MAKNWKQPKQTDAQKRKEEADSHHTIARNKRARHDYEVEETWEAGLVLSGTEVKALRMGRASIVDGWVEVKGSEAWIYGMNIPMYSHGSWTNHSPTRKRKLLLHKSEIRRMGQKVAAKGYALIPLELYFLRGRAKVEVALGRGKKEWDKRQSLREAQDKREAQRAMSKYLRKGSV